MAVIYTTSRKVRADPEGLIKVLLNPEAFLKGLKYVESLEKSGDVWIITFKWSKFGMAATYDVDFSIYRDGNTVVYESVEGSPHRARVVFSILRLPKEGVIGITATAEFDLGGLAAFLGKGDFGKFVDEVVDAAVKSYMRSLLRREGLERVDCRYCVFYEAERRYCYALDEPVSDPTRPPCKGSMFKRAEPKSSGEFVGGRGAEESSEQGKEKSQDSAEGSE